MKVSIHMGYEKAIADLSGAELEQLTKLIGKLTRVDREYLGGKHFNVVKADEAVKWTFEIGGDADAPTISRDVADKMKEGEATKRRAELVAKCHAEPSTDNTDALKKQLYYDGVMNKAERDDSFHERASEEHGVVDFFYGDKCIRVNADGTTETHDTAK